ncbi:hypothetical protein [Nocardia sp. XZ_19_385]|uniref:hypothetical protein n=1 Tax=Nocardia sp. XZ_19_385 TaxID=2769488 RepID=UPI00188E7C5A|nr:hypothetical protein [Nocardia sp. XZ_19_385]
MPKPEASNRWSRGKKVGAVLGGIALATVTAVVTTYAARLISGIEERVTDPVEVAVEDLSMDRCPSTFMLPGKPQDYPPVPSQEQTLDWARGNGAIEGLRNLVRVTITGSRADQPVVLDRLRIEVLRRESPVAGFVTGSQCGGPLDRRYFQADIDQAPVVLESEPAKAGLNPEQAKDFPYFVSGSEVEQFYLRLTAETCNCDWRAVLEWTSGAREGEIVIDNDGKPFRIHGTQGYPRYQFGNGPSNLVRVN